MSPHADSRVNSFDRNMEEIRYRNKTANGVRYNRLVSNSTRKHKYQNSNERQTTQIMMPAPVLDKSKIMNY